MYHNGMPRVESLTKEEEYKLNQTKRGSGDVY
jgi:hypothetical protein